MSSGVIGLFPAERDVFRARPKDCIELRRIVMRPTNYILPHDAVLAYNQVMEPIIVRSVKDIQASEKRWLEDALGGKLQDDQQICIMVLSPGEVPDDDTRQKARQGLQRTFQKTEEYARLHSITAQQADATVHEAAEHTRRRTS